MSHTPGNYERYNCRVCGQLCNICHQDIQALAAGRPNSRKVREMLSDWRRTHSTPPSVAVAEKIVRRDLGEQVRRTRKRGRELAKRQRPAPRQESLFDVIARAEKAKAHDRARRKEQRDGHEVQTR